MITKLGKGSKQANMEFFEDCSYVMQFDRRSYTTDVIEHTNGIQVLSGYFKDSLIPIMDKYSYGFNRGTFTDVGVLASKGIGINVFNVSNGSFNEHCQNEVCGLKHMLNALNFGIDVVNNIGKTRLQFKAENEFAPKKRNKQMYERI